MVEVRLLPGDCRDVLPTLPAHSVDALVTDPPYAIGFMGHSWDSGVALDPRTWVHVLRVMKPGAHGVIFGGVTSHHRMACAVEDAGLEIRDTLMWLYSNGVNKSRHHLKPAWEPVYLVRAPVDGSVAENIELLGVGGLNAAACRLPPDQGRHRGSEPSARKRYKPTSVISAGWLPGPRGGHPDGRWPANVVHDGSDEVLEALGRTARFYYCAKATRQDRDEGLEDLEAREVSRYAPAQQGGTAQQTARVLTPQKNWHSTVKPTELMRWLCRLIAPPGGVVLDPFSGSGSTGKAAVLEGRPFVGIDLTAEYMPLAAGRIAAVQTRAA